MKGHVARKRFGQNFLVDGAIISAIINVIDPQRTDTVVEIGPGLGALTQPLLARLAHLHVVEIDRDLIERLKKQHSPERLTIHAGDALTHDFAAIGSDLRLVGNLPYNISTPLLFHLADYGNKVRDMHFMLQKEVVERMVAAPGSSDFGRLSVMLQYRFHLEWLLDVPPESFDPPPKVQSAIVRLIPKTTAELTAHHPARFAHVVQTAFSQRRKMLRNTLKGVLDENGFAALNINPTLRPEDLAVADYVRIANFLTAAS
jgi:16S rRNA (adenine1518-N6/adenine1519-N6)-dimethyltransferase